jgi:hypothetical protein
LRGIILLEVKKRSVTLKRGRKQKTGDRYPSGKLKPQPDVNKGPLLDYQLDQAREFIRDRVTDPIWIKRAGWLNLNQRLSDDLTSAAFFYTLFAPHQFVAPKRNNPNPGHPRNWIHGRPTPSPPDVDEGRWTAREQVELMDRIKRQLTVHELRAVKDYALKQEQPFNWGILERALTKVHRILEGASPTAKNTLMDKRRSEFVSKDVPVMWRCAA